MPTTIPLAVRQARDEPLHGESHATAISPHLAVVAVLSFVAAGLALTIALALQFPLVANAIVLSGIAG